MNILKSNFRTVIKTCFLEHIFLSLFDTFSVFMKSYYKSKVLSLRECFWNEALPVCVCCGNRCDGCCLELLNMFPWWLIPIILSNFFHFRSPSLTWCLWMKGSPTDRTQRTQKSKISHYLSNNFSEYITYRDSNATTVNWIWYYSHFECVWMLSCWMCFNERCCSWLLAGRCLRRRPSYLLRVSVSAAIWRDSWNPLFQPMQERWADVYNLKYFIILRNLYRTASVLP